MNVEIAKATYQTGNEGGLVGGGRIGRMAEMSGRMVYFYADQLTEMLVDDILEDTALEL